MLRFIFRSLAALAAVLSFGAVDAAAETAATTTKRLTLDTMSKPLLKMEYAVRGQVVIAADKISDELAAGSKKYPFDHIVYTNIGNPQSVGQRPLTWPRQVLALVDLPDEVGVDHPKAIELFPADAIARAREIKIGLGGHGSGAYSHSKGVRCFRDDVAKFIEERDGGVPSDPEDIFLTNGASAGIVMILCALIADDSCGAMLPIPQVRGIAYRRQVADSIQCNFLICLLSFSSVFSITVVPDLQRDSRPIQRSQSGVLPGGREGLGTQYSRTRALVPGGDR